MSVIIVENSEKIPHTFKLDIELMKKYNPSWDTVHFSRCPRCSRIFISKTDRKYCSKECQYNRGCKKVLETKDLRSNTHM